MFTLIIADDHKIVRDGVRQLIGSRDDIQVVAETNDGLETISALKRLQPNAALLDVSMPYASALEVCIEAKRWSPSTRIIIFTGTNTGSALRELINEGAKAIVLKSEELQELNRAFDAVLSDKTYYSGGTKTLIDSAQTVTQLTSREKQILTLVVTGNSTNEIAETLSISAKTVDNHRTNLMRKLNLHSVSELMAYAYREKIVLQANDSQ
jgi:DNA-binding NarL/FixJ family response regulator